MKLTLISIVLIKLSFVLCETKSSTTKKLLSDNNLIRIRYRAEFEKWMKENNRTYKSSAKTKEKAMEIYLANVKENEAHNKIENITYTRSTCQHSDMSLEEIRKYRLGLKQPLRTRKLMSVPLAAMLNAMTPESVNYTKFMTPVKDQQSCGSCYTFAATAVAEYQVKKIGGNLSLSQQNIIDCDIDALGCEGGWPTHALNYIRDEGVAEDSLYVYQAQKLECRKQMFPIVCKANKVCEVDVGNDEEKLKKLIANVGPVAAVITTTDGLFNYGDGVFYDPACDSNAFDHAVVIVGYGTHRVFGDYWIIRNSWGETWGRRGYGHIARNRKNKACGLANYAMYIC